MSGTPSRYRIRLQFSLATLFGLMTLSALGVWYWYQRPFEVETKVADPFGPPVTAGWTYREVDTVRRLWGGKTMRHGPRRVYDSTGRLTTTENYRNGEKHGQFIRYTKQGTKSSEQTFVRGKRHGPSLRWDSSGNLTAEENYADDLRHGPFLDRYPDGTLAIDAKYERGMPTGKWTWSPVAKQSSSEPARGTITGQWQDAVPQGHWEWRDADNDVYLAADFQDGHVAASQELAIHPQALESVVYAAGRNPALMTILFRPINLEFQDLPLKDVVLQCTRTANVPIRFDFRSMAAAYLSPDLPISAHIADEPLLVGISKMLRPYSLDCDFRHGMLCIVPASSLATWEDATDVSGIIPPPGSHLADEWTKTTTVDVVEMPLKDVALYLQEVHRVRFDLSLMPTTPQPNASFVTADTPVTASLRGISFKEALAIILENIGCKASLQGETIVIDPQ
jgi:hypothetical protein